MCKFVVLVLALCIIMPAFATVFSTRGNSLYNGFPKRTQSRIYTNQYRPQSHCNYCHGYRHHRRVGNMDALERYAFKKNYARENNFRRLERLENLAFGATQEGDYATRFKNVEAAILSRPQATQKRSILGNIANYFAGTPTGFTPSITDTIITPSYVTPGSIPYLSPTMNSMMPMGGFSTSPSYDNQRFEQYSNGIWGNGYRSFGNNFGNGSSVTILD